MRTLFLAAFAVIALLSIDPTATFSQTVIKPIATAPETALRPITEDRETKSQRQYVFECQLSEEKSKLLKSERIIADPRIIVTENREAKLERISQKPFVTSVKIVGTSKSGEDVYQPVITVLDEGYRVTVNMSSIDDKQVQVDIRLEMLTISEVDTVKVSERTTTQAPTHNSVTQRIVRIVKLGETLRQVVPVSIKEKPLTFEYTVKETGIHTEGGLARAMREK